MFLLQDFTRLSLGEKQNTTKDQERVRWNTFGGQTVRVISWRDKNLLYDGLITYFLVSVDPVN